MELGLELTSVGREKIRSYSVSGPSPVGDFLVTSWELRWGGHEGSGWSRGVQQPHVFLTPSQREPSL